MKKIKLGIIGTGLAARNLHWPALRKLKQQYQITAVCNHTERKAKEFSKLVGKVPYYIDYKKMLREADVEAVDIALPINLNYQVALDSIKAGKHVFLEKPLAANIYEGKKLLQAEKQYGAVCLLAENFRYRKIFANAKEFIKKGIIGKPYSFVWNLYYNITKKNEYAKTTWRKNHTYAGGFLLDAGVHNIAAIRLLFGDVKNGTSYIKSINPDIGEYDTMSLSCEMKNGIHGIYNIYFSVKGLWEDQFLIFGSKGTLQILTNKLTLMREQKKDQLCDCSDGNGYDIEFMDFYNAITKGATVKSSFEEGFKDMSVVLKAIEAGEKELKRRVEF